MDEVYVVRHKVLVEGRSVRQVAQEMGIARNTVRRYVRGAPPGVRRAAARSRPVMDAVRARAEAILGEAPRWTGGKQRLTATRLHRMLVEEGQRVGETVVKAIVREWRRRRQEVFVPLVYKPGDLAQVDFFEVLVDIEGDRRKAFLFVMRLMHSGRDFAWLYPRQDQVCFLDGHARAFSHFGAVPHRLAYDNFKAAVARILVGSERVLSARFLALTTHYLFEASFARPYTGHDKGGVEARGKGIRWQELVPGPARTRGLCADAAGFGLHAATRAGAGGARAREALVKYILRPPMANEHLTLRSDGLVRVALKRPFRDGTIAVDMDPLSLLCRLAAAVPPPRQHRWKLAPLAALRFARGPSRYAGVLAPAATLRPRVIPAPPDDPPEDDLEPEGIARFLTALRLPTTAPPLAPARALPYWQSRVLRRKDQEQDHQLSLT